MRGYAFLGTTIEITSDLPPVVAWLDEFLTPAFDLWTGEASDFAVRIRTDPAAYEAVASTRPGEPLAAEPCFALDREVVHHPSWPASGGTALVDGKFGTLYVLQGTQADVFVEPGSDRYRGGAMRVVREIAATRALSSADRLQLHAAAFVVGGRAVLLAGPKNAGKTTVLAYLAASTGVPMLANDRVLLSLTESGFEVRGVPTIVSIRAETLGFLPRLAGGIPDVERPAHLTLAETEAAFAARGGVSARARLKLSPAQLARQLGVRLAARAGLAAVAFPEPDPDTRGLSVEHLPATEAESRLHEARFGVHSAESGPTVFARLTSACRPEHADGALIATLAAQVPCFSVKIGADRYREPRAAEAILSSVL